MQAARQFPHRRATGFLRKENGWLCALMLSTFLATGCQVLGRPNETIVRVQTRQNQARAARLTRAGIAALNKGQIDHAADKFVAAIDADMAYGPAHNNLGLMHYEEGNLYQAAMAFQHALEYLPHDPTTRYNLALTLEAAGQTEQAEQLYYEANEMDPANPIYLGNLVRLRVRMGEYDDHLIEQLKELVLIETRPEWRRWADKQLALNLNPVLDRGPEAPDFNTSRKKDLPRDEEDIAAKVIDLTPDSHVRAGFPAPGDPGENEPPSMAPSVDEMELGPDRVLEEDSFPEELAPPQTRMEPGENPGNQPGAINIRPVVHEEPIVEIDYYRAD